MEVKSRLRFLAYSRGLSAEFGLRFLIFVIQFIRAKLSNYHRRLLIGLDNGSEFCAGSKRKEAAWNAILSELNAEIYSYEPGHDIRKNLIERSHLTDDEEFFIPRGKFIEDKNDFLREAQAYFIYFNAQRAHSGLGMANRTPIEVIRDAGITGFQRLLYFPVLMLEEILTSSENVPKLLNSFMKKNSYFQKTGTYKFDPKTLCDLKPQFNFLDQSAQNVLTYYRVSMRPP